MRRLFLILVACAPGFAQTLSTAATCNGVTYYGTFSASCGESNTTNASASSGGGFVDALASSLASDSSSASASFSEAYILTVMGGIGDGFADPGLSAGGDSFGAEDVAYSSAALYSNSGGCEASGDPLPPYSFSTCGPTSMSFVFGVPQTVDIDLSATATSGPGYEDPGVNGGAGIGGFSFYDANGNPLNGVTYTFVPAPPPPTPTPEPGMFPLLAAIASAALIARKRLRRSFPVC
jgi:hypothetical protein